MKRPGLKEFADGRGMLVFGGMPATVQLLIRPSESAPSRLKSIFVAEIPDDDGGVAGHMPVSPELRIELS